MIAMLQFDLRKEKQVNIAFSISVFLHLSVFLSVYLMAPGNVRVPRVVEFEIHRVKKTVPPVEKPVEIPKEIVDLTKVRNFDKLQKMKIHRSSKANAVEEVKPVVGVAEESVSEEGAFPVPVGNTLMGTPENKVQEVHYAPLFRVVELPRFRERVEPGYPELAKRAGIEGTVILEVSINHEGKVIEAKVKQGLGYGCDEAALEAVTRARFHPARDDNGQAVAVKVPIPFRFRIVY